MSTILERALRTAAKSYVENQIQMVEKAKPRSPASRMASTLAEPDEKEITAIRKLSASGSYLYDPNRHIALLQRKAERPSAINKKAP